MELSIYNIIKGPRISNKVYHLNQKFNQLVLEVHPHANKPLVAQALKELFNVTADKIRIVVSKGKFKRSGRHIYQGKTRKKAYVTLKEGQSIDIMNWTSVDAGSSESVKGGE